MAKALEVNDNTAQVRERRSRQQSGDKPNQQKLQGKSFQVNQNSVEDQEPARSPAPQRPAMIGGEENPRYRRPVRASSSRPLSSLVVPHSN